MQNKQAGKAIVGRMLRRKRISNGEFQRHIAIDLGLANPSYLSMIENGTHPVPLKRLIDFGEAYKLERTETLAIVKLTSPEIWATLLNCIKVIGMNLNETKELDKEIDFIIEQAAIEADIKLLY